MDDSSTAKRKRTQRDYNLAFKLAVVAQLEKAEMTYRQVQSTRKEHCFGMATQTWQFELV
jgi:hypothetical protein